MTSSILDIATSHLLIFRSKHRLWRYTWRKVNSSKFREHLLFYVYGDQSVRAKWHSTAQHSIVRDNDKVIWRLFYFFLFFIYFFKLFFISYFFYLFLICFSYFYFHLIFHILEKVCMSLKFFKYIIFSLIDFFIILHDIIRSFFIDKYYL